MFTSKQVIMCILLVCMPITTQAESVIVPIISFLFSDSGSVTPQGENNHAPRVFCNEVLTYYDAVRIYRGGVLDISFSVIDDDGDEMVSYTVTRQPTYARIEGSGKYRRLVSTDNRFTGDDYFEMKANDGTEDSEITRINVKIQRANSQSAPLVNSMNLLTRRGVAKEFILKGFDGSGDSLVYTVIMQPQHGTLTGIPPHLTYTPNSNFAGTDRITFKANDGMLDSLEASVRIEVYKKSYYILKKSEQTQSHDNDGNLDSTIKDDGYYQTGVSHNFTRNNTTKIVHDHITGLMWQDDVLVKKVWMTTANLEECKKDYKTRKSSLCDDTSGDTAATYCSGLTLGGYTDWRMPTMLELDTVINNKTQAHFFSAFKQHNGGYFWSATTTSMDSEGYNALALKSCIGVQGRFGKDYKLHGAVKCVRNAE